MKSKTGKSANKRQKKLATIPVEVILEAGQHTRTVSALEALAKAESYLDARDYGSCGQICAQLINSGKLYVEPYVLMLRVAINMGRVREMLDITGKLHDHGVKSAHDVLVLNHALKLCNRHQEALSLLDAAIKDFPADFRLREQRAMTHADLGRFEEAAEEFRLVIRMSPNRYAAYHMLSAVDSLTDAEIEALQKAKPGGDEREYVKFALARAYERRGDKKSELECLRAANEARRQRLQYDHAQETERNEKLIEWTTREYIDGFTAPPAAGARPVFVIGMPGAGPAVIEQSVTGHPDIGTAGQAALFEYTLLDNVRKKHPGTDWPDILLKLSNSDLGYLCDEYREAVAAVYTKNEVFVDYTPGYYRYVGLLALAMPDAKFIHAVRHPMATCLSCYRRSWDEAEFRGDIEEIAKHHLDQLRVMRHWNNLLGDRIIDVNFEDLIRNPEHQLRETLAFCDVPWNDTVLEDQRGNQAVRKSLWAQINGPPVEVTLDRWRDYEELLRPARDILEPELGPF